MSNIGEIKQIVTFGREQIEQVPADNIRRLFDVMPVDVMQEEATMLVESLGMLRHGVEQAQPEVTATKPRIEGGQRAFREALKGSDDTDAVRVLQSVDLMADERDVVESLLGTMHSDMGEVIAMIQAVRKRIDKIEADRSAGLKRAAGMVALQAKVAQHANAYVAKH